MAVRVETFVPVPPYPKEEAPRPIPITGEKAQEIIQERIDRVVSFIQRPFSLGTYMPDIHLFGIAKSIGRVWPDGGKAPFTMEEGDLQRVGLDLMKRYGLSEDVFIVKSRTPHGNGTIREHREYLSQTVKNLVFNRWHNFVESTGEPTNVDWRVGHDPVLLFRLNLGRLFKR